jgi:drug/metabolite transporter, DME family
LIEANVQTSQRNKGLVYVLAAAVLWGTTGTAQAFAPAGASSLAIGAMRLAIGGTALLLVALVRRSFQRGALWPFWPTLLGAASMAAYQPAFFAGVARTGVAVGTIVAIGSAPILAGLIGVLLYGERPSQRWTFATFLAVSGSSLLVLSGSEVAVDVGGILLAIGAGAAYAVYTFASKALVDQHAPDAVSAVLFSLGALFLAPLLFTVDLGWLPDTRGWLVTLHLGVVATAAAYALYVRGLARLPSATAVTLALAEPLTATLLGVFVLGEYLATTAASGIALICVGLLLLTGDKA